MIGDEKWIQYDNPKSKKSHVKPDQPAKSKAKQRIHIRQGNAKYFLFSVGSEVHAVL